MVKTTKCTQYKNEEHMDIEMSCSHMIDDESIDEILLISHDITSRKKIEREKTISDSIIRNQQKLEVIGTLASGVAHEINNPINGILNYGQIILDADPNDTNIKEYAKEIISETNRISQIVKDLLGFSRQSNQYYSFANIEDIISQTLSLVKTTIKHDQIELIVDIAGNLPRIKCRSQQIQQVIMNLLTNAHDALNEKFSGYDQKKIMKLSCSQLNTKDRKWLEIVVEDHGVGISEDIMDKIFDPFFTTKEHEKGTGLGLSISYAIVKEHQGEMKIETEIGKYTRFILHLPCNNE